MEVTNPRLLFINTIVRLIINNMKKSENNDIFYFISQIMDGDEKWYCKLKPFLQKKTLING
jgi:hypothetical protein